MQKRNKSSIGITSKSLNNPSNSTIMKETCDYSNQAYPPSVFYKAACIDFYLKKYKCKIITSEFRYGINQFVTDLLILTSRNTISIEIKTEHDDLRRLEGQISESRKHFNLTIVFAAAKHKAELLATLPSDIGITIFDNGQCKIVRTPKRNIPDISEIIASIPALFLRKYFKIHLQVDSDKVRQEVLEHHRPKIKECFSEYITNKFSKNYIQFLYDRGEQTHVDDISTLTMKSIIEIN